jgi:tRNA-Thr(GGU) m(6)t(6)A37 methyltransferase TsaA
MVRVEPVTEAWAEALALGDAAFTARFAVPVETGWAVFPEVVPYLVEAAREGPSQWGPHLVFDDDGALVGTAGWKGPPVAGVAELGYSVAPGRRGRGVATAAVRVLLDRARATGLRAAVAHTLPATSPSTTVLARCGFAKVGEAVDPDDGPVWRWEVSLGGPVFHLRPIGRVESPLADVGRAPKQGDEGGVEATLVFDPDVLDGLAGVRAGDRIVVLTWLDRARRDVLRVHPRDDRSQPEQGVFTTRSADRPNPIGLHPVEVVSVDGSGRRVRVRHLETVDGTPVVDVKPVLG